MQTILSSCTFAHPFTENAFGNYCFIILSSRIYYYYYIRSEFECSINFLFNHHEDYGYAGNHARKRFSVFFSQNIVIVFLRARDQKYIREEQDRQSRSILHCTKNRSCLQILREFLTDYLNSVIFSSAWSSLNWNRGDGVLKGLIELINYSFNEDDEAVNFSKFSGEWIHQNWTLKERVVSISKPTVNAIN